MTNLKARFNTLSPKAQDLFLRMQASEFKTIQLVDRAAIILNSSHVSPRALVEPLIKELFPTFLERTGKEQWQIPEPLRGTTF